MPAKVLFIDIETAPILAYVWDIWQQNVGLNQIKKDWHLLAFAAKWMGTKNIIYQDQSKVKNIENDKALAKSIWTLLNDADMVITQNGVSFDIPKIRARMLYHKLPPPSPFRQIDTLKIAKRVFGFTSNKLEYTSSKFTDTPKDHHRLFPGFELWAECLKGNPKAWGEMKKYNIRDVVSLEKYYLRLQPWTDKHPNVGMYINMGVVACPKCGSLKVQQRGYAYTSVGMYQRYQCMDCSGWSKGRTLLNGKEDRKLQLAN